MCNVDRRSLLEGAISFEAARAVRLFDVAQAWAQATPWKPESGAHLALLRWKHFMQAENDAFEQLLDAFTKATGVMVDVTRESIEDVQPKASVAANTGAGPDLFWASPSATWERSTTSSCSTIPTPRRAPTAC